MGCEKHYKSEIRSSDLEPTSWVRLTASKSTSANLSECDSVGRVPFALRCARRKHGKKNGLYEARSDLTKHVVPHTAGSKQKNRLVKPGLLPAWALAALHGRVLTERTLEMPRFRWGLKRPPRRFVWLVTLVLILGAANELRTSAVQSRLFSYWAKLMTHTVGQGPSTNIVFPRAGPFDVRHGYSQIPEFRSRLESRGFQVAEQARFSPTLVRVSRLGITPPYRESANAGLTIRSADGVALYEASPGRCLFRAFDEIPPLIIQALLLMENRELGSEPSDASSNPVLEWDRLAKAGLSYAGSKLGLPMRMAGGSTLATQLEKYQHSPGGRTPSAAEKLRQITGASLKVYRSGIDTRTARHEIILD